MHMTSLFCFYDHSTNWYRQIHVVNASFLFTSIIAVASYCLEILSGKMYLKSQLTWDVVVPPENIDSEGLTLQRAILVRIMSDFATKKTSKDLGYHLAVTTLDHIGEGKIRQHSGDILFPVTFSCITFKMLMGEVLDGTFHKILKHGVFLKCGPADKVFLSHVKMMGYHYVPGEKPVFKNENGSTIEKGTVVRFVVVSEKYYEAECDFRALVSMDGEFLGPV